MHMNFIQNIKLASRYHITGHFPQKSMNKMIEIITFLGSFIGTGFPIYVKNIHFYYSARDLNKNISQIKPMQCISENKEDYAIISVIPFTLYTCFKEPQYRLAFLEVAGVLALIILSAQVTAIFLRALYYTFNSCGKKLANDFRHHFPNKSVPDKKNYPYREQSQSPLINLPLDMKNELIKHLDLHALCQLRLTCKNWSNIITRKDFLTKIVPKWVFQGLKAYQIQQIFEQAKPVTIPHCLSENFEEKRRIKFRNFYEYSLPSHLGNLPIRWGNSPNGDLFVFIQIQINGAKIPFSNRTQPLKKSLICLMKKEGSKQWEILMPKELAIMQALSAKCLRPLRLSSGYHLNKRNMFSLYVDGTCKDSKHLLKKTFFKEYASRLISGKKVGNWEVDAQYNIVEKPVTPNSYVQLLPLPPS